MPLESTAEAFARRFRAPGRSWGTHGALARALPKAGYLVLPETYVARSFMIGVGAFLIALIVPVSLGLAALSGLRPSWAAWGLAALLPVAAGGVAYAIRMRWPSVRAPLRARAIEAQMPFAINYMSTLASGRLTLDQVFADLAQQDVYGEIAKEAGLVHRDLAYLGKDLVGALNAAIERSPSRKWEDFLQGLLISLTSGGDLPSFLVAKSEQYFAELRTLQRGFLDNLALLAEVFVVIVVAAPLLFIIMISILTLFGRSAHDVLALGYALVFLLLPITQLAFGTVIRIMTPEG